MFCFRQRLIYSISVVCPRRSSVPCLHALRTQLTGGFAGNTRRSALCRTECLRHTRKQIKLNYTALKRLTVHIFREVKERAK